MQKRTRMYFKRAVGTTEQGVIAATWMERWQLRKDFSEGRRIWVKPQKQSKSLTSEVITVSGWRNGINSLHLESLSYLEVVQFGVTEGSGRNTEHCQEQIQVWETFQSTQILENYSFFPPVLHLELFSWCRWTLAAN